ncbi:hypothetical protein ABK040_013413 [Willaertia magna]
MTNERNEIYLIKQENLKTHFEQLKVTVELKKVFSGLSNKIYFISGENDLYSVETEGGKKLEKLKSKTSLSQQFIYTFSGFNFAYVITSHSALFVNGFSSEEVDRMKKLLFNQLKSVNNRFSDKSRINNNELNPSCNKIQKPSHNSVTKPKVTLDYNTANKLLKQCNAERNKRNKKDSSSKTTKSTSFYSTKTENNISTLYSNNLKNYNNCNFNNSTPLHNSPISEKEKARLQQIDKHALSCPFHHSTSNIKEITNYLIQITKTPKEKLRGIYRWICENTAYDAKSYFTKTFQNNYDNPEVVLKRGKGLCVGITKLFQAMAHHAGFLDIEIVSGFCKGYGYHEENKKTKLDGHCWNGVFIDYELLFIDATWGAGGLCPIKKEFVKGFKDFYFLVKPDQLIYSHFPDSQHFAWQRCCGITSLEEFKNLIELGPNYFTNNLQLLLPKIPKMEDLNNKKEKWKAKRGEFILTFYALEDVLFKLECKAPGENDFCVIAESGSSSLVFKRRNKEILDVELKMLSTGKFEFKILSKRIGEADFGKAMEFEVVNEMSRYLVNKR